MVHNDYSRLTDAELEAIIADKTASLGYEPLTRKAGRASPSLIEHMPSPGPFGTRHGRVGN